MYCKTCLVTLQDGVNAILKLVDKMKEYIISTGTVTYALKGRDILRKKGIKAYVERITSGKGSAGCGYAIITEGDLKQAEKLLKEAGVKILEINQRA